MSGTTNLNLSGTQTLSVSNLSMSGTINVNSNVTVASSSNWTWSSGTIQGSGTLTIPSGITLNVPDASGSTYVDANIVLDGTVAVGGSGYNELVLDGGNTCSSPDTLTVASGGALDLTANDDSNPLISGDCYGAINVQSGGTLAKTGGTGTSTINGVPVTVTGTHPTGH